MAEEKKGFWSKLKGSKKSSGCCSMKIEEIPEDAPEETGAEGKEKAKKAEPAPCCGGAKTPSRGGGGSCCG